MLKSVKFCLFLLPVYLVLWAKHAGLFVSQLLVGFHIRIISIFGNTEFKSIVMCNLYRIFTCIRILKSCKSKLYCSLDDKAHFCTACHMLD